MKLTGQIALRCSNALPLATDPAQITVLNDVIGLWGARLLPTDRKTVPAAMQVCRDLGVELPTYGYQTGRCY